MWLALRSVKSNNVDFKSIPQKIGKERGNSYHKNEEISRLKAHINTWKLIWRIWTITDVFLNPKRVNVCEHTVKMMSSLLCVHIHLLSSDWERHVETYHLSFHVFICAFHLEISSFFSVRVSYFYVICTSVLSFSTVFLFHDIFFIFPISVGLPTLESLFLTLSSKMSNLF